MIELAAATEEYAAYWNALLGYDGDDLEFRQQLEADCDKAYARMWELWVEHTTGGAS